MRFLSFIFIILFIVSCDDNKSNFTATADTIIEPNSQISKYVTQDEVDSFAMRHWDIDDFEYEEKNATLKPLRVLFKSKDTAKIIKYIKDNNVSVNAKFQRNTTPIMYSSFYDDVNTTKALISMGADIKAFDKHGLSALAYAIENNATNTVKTLRENGAKFSELKYVQWYLGEADYDRINKIIIDGDNITLNFRNLNKPVSGAMGQADPIDYVLARGFIEIGKMMMEDGYRGTEKITYENFIYFAGYEDMLDLLLEYNLVEKPNDEFLKSEYEECYDEYRIFLNTQLDYDKGELQLKDYEISDLKRTLEYYSKNCNVKNSTFTTKTYIIWKNTSNKNWAIDRFLTKYRDDKTKVIYINKNSNSSNSAIVEPNSSNPNFKTIN